MDSIVALNIQHGGSKRTAALIDWLGKQEADIIALSEWRDNPRGLAIEAALRSNGYDVQSQDGTISNGVLIADREQFEASAVTPADAKVGVLLEARWKSGLTSSLPIFRWHDRKLPRRRVKLAKTQFQNESGVTSATVMLKPANLQVDVVTATVFFGTANVMGRNR